jgi:hypothetical protein
MHPRASANYPIKTACKRKSPTLVFIANST